MCQHTEASNIKQVKWLPDMLATISLIQTESHQLGSHTLVRININSYMVDETQQHYRHGSNFAG